MDEHQQHNVHDHSGQEQEKEDQSQPNTTSDAAHAAMDHVVHTMSDLSADDTHQDHVMPASGEMAHIRSFLPGLFE